MKKFLLLALIFVGGITASAEDGEATKFQLFQGTFTPVSFQTKKVRDEKVIFKINIQTGQVWKYSIGVSKRGKIFEHWVAVKEKQEN